MRTSARRALLLAAVSASVAARAHADPPPRPAPAHPPVTAAELYPQTHDAPSVVSRVDVGGERPRLFDRSEPDASPEARALRETEASLREQQEHAFPTRVAGGTGYYRRLSEQLVAAWRPPAVPPPSVGETLVNNVFSSTATALATTAISQGPLVTQGRTAAAVDELQAAHPNSPTLRPANTGSSIAAATARRTRAEIEVDQDETGALLAVRVAHSSGELLFDARAVEAVRAAAQTTERTAMPGGWRSRWAFEVTTSRDPLVVLAPTAPGDRPTPVAWAEVTDDGELHTPLRAHERHRVWLLSSRRLRGPASGR